MTAYPFELEFEISDDADRRAVLDAAEELRLPVTRQPYGDAFTVTVTTAKEAYEFGAYTQAHYVKRAARQ